MATKTQNAPGPRGVVPFEVISEKSCASELQRDAPPPSGEAFRPDDVPAGRERRTSRQRHDSEHALPDLEAAK
jgi:hypothetical protein